MEKVGVIVAQIMAEIRESLAQAGKLPPGTWDKLPEAPELPRPRLRLIKGGKS